MPWKQRSDIHSTHKWLPMSISEFRRTPKGSLLIGNQRVVAHFCEDRDFPQRKDNKGNFVSTPKQPPGIPQSDWECSRCGCNNFRHRNSCFRCEASRSEAENISIPSADEQVGLAPCNTLLLRNLDLVTDDAKIIQNLMTVLPSSVIKSCKIMRDPRSQQSVGYGFVQFRSLPESTDMYNCLMRINPPLTIDGKQVAVSFAKSPLNEILSPPAQPAASFPSSSARPIYAQGNDANSAAAVAQLALQQLQKSQMNASIVQQHMQTARQQSGQVPSSYQYDAASGYYYDPASRLYYDAKTQYFWNPQTQQFLLWNAQTQAYSAVAPTVTESAPVQIAASVEAAPAPIVETPEEKPKLETEKEKKAKQIVQEMEKWVKSQNSKSGTKKPPPQPEVKIGQVASVFADAEEEEVAQSDIGKSLSYKTVTIAPATHMVTLPIFGDRKRYTPEPELSDQHSRHSSSPVPNIPVVESFAVTRQKAAEEQLVDWDRLLCLLCQRKFAAREALKKHVNESPMHLTNLHAHRKQTMTEEEIEEMEVRDPQYRDRAKERRQKFGESEPAPALRGPAAAAQAAANRKRAAPSESHESDEEETATPGLGSSNVGAKLLAKMGWSEGKGLGKSKQGIVDPIEARAHSGTTGLGAMAEGAPDILPTDTYASKVRKTMRNRFRQMTD